jgi:hypothetical protein
MKISPIAFRPLGCDVVYCGILLSMFRRNLLFPY